jgi:hypothetical protein
MRLSLTVQKNLTAQDEGAIDLLDDESAKPTQSPIIDKEKSDIRLPNHNVVLNFTEKPALLNESKLTVESAADTQAGSLTSRQIQATP